MQSLYLIISRNKQTGEFSWHCTGRNMTPFSTLNLGTAKAQVTKLTRKLSMREYSIVTVDIQHGTALMDLTSLRL